MRWYHWIIVPFILLFAVAVSALSGRRESIESVLRSELDAIDSKATVKKIQAQHGAIEARKWVEEKYHEELSELDEQQTAKAIELRDNPVALTEWLSRIGR